MSATNITLGITVLCMLVALILALFCLRREKTSNAWALCWAAVAGLFLGTTGFGEGLRFVFQTIVQATVDAIRSVT